MRTEIEYLGVGAETSLPGPTMVLYVGGPYHGRREVVYGRQPTASVIISKGPGQASGADERGHYQRSVRCADDGVLRYVWVVG